MKKLLAILVTCLAVMTLTHFAYASPLNNVILAHQYESDLTDSHASYDGTCAGCTYDTSTPKLGTASVVLNGSSDRITTAYNPSAVTEVSVSAWGNHDSGAANDALFGWTSGTTGLMFQTISGGVLLFFGPNGNDYATYSMTTTGWHHYVAVFNGGVVGNANRLKLYVDGSAVSLSYNASVPASITMQTGFTVGDAGASFGRYWDGKIDEVTVWDRAVLASEVTTLYNSSTGLEYSFGVDSIVTFDAIDKAYQRDDTSLDIDFSGAYSGSTTPTAIEVQIEDDDGNVEQAWATCDSSPSGGTWSCTKTVNAASDDLVAWARFSNDTDVDFYTPSFIVGDLVLAMWQSNCEYYSTSVSGNDSTVVEGIWTYYHAENGASAVWRRPANRGDVAFLETIAASSDYAVALLNLCVNTTGLNASADNGNGYWLDTTASSLYDQTKTFVAGLQNSVAAILFVGGENDIFEGITVAQFGTDLTTFIDRARTDFENGSGGASIPFILTTLGGSLTVADPDVTDVRAQAYREKLMDAEDDNTNTFSVMTSHLPQQDVWHPTANAAGYGQHGMLSAQTVLYSWGEATYYQGPVVHSVTYVDSTHVDVNITHTSGTDFTPTSSITGFEANGGVSITSADRQDADTIRLTLDGELAAGVGTIKYLYGENPDQSAAVVDNTALTEPLLFFDEVTVTAEGSGSTDPCTDYAVGTILYCGDTGTILYEPADSGGTTTY